MNNGKLSAVFPELSSQLRVSRMLEGIKNVLIHLRTQ